MRPRIADTLREFGCAATTDEFRAALAEIKAESYPEFTGEELSYTKNQAGEYCSLVRKRLAAPRLTRPFILRSLVGLRKHKPKAGAKVADVAQSVDA